MRRVTEMGPDKVAQGVWGVQDLRERPAPMLEGSVAFPCFRALKYNAATQTITSANDGYITFDRYQTTDATKIDFDGWVAGTPDTFTVVNFKVRGLWAITIMVELDFAGSPTKSDFCGIAMEDAGATFMAAPGINFPIWEPPGDNSSGFYSWTHIQSFPPVWADLTSDTLAPDLPAARWNFSNNGGSTVTINYAMVEIHLLYEFDYETLAVQSQA